AGPRLWRLRRDGGDHGRVRPGLRAGTGQRQAGPARAQARSRGADAAHHAERVPRHRAEEAAGVSLADLGGWLARQAAAEPALAPRHRACCGALVERGLRFWRSTLGLETLHPEISGTQLIWLAGTLEETEAERRGILTRPDYVNSPTRIVDESGKPFRRHLDRPVPKLPLLEALRGRGATDYAMLPLPFIDQSLTSVISFATLAAGGFSDAQLAELEDAARLLSPYAERQVLRRIAIDLLDTYVGHSAGEKVFAGQVQRGDIESIYAA